MDLAEYFQAKLAQVSQAYAGHVKVALASVVSRVCGRLYKPSVNFEDTESTDYQRRSQITTAERYEFLAKMQALKAEVAAKKQQDFVKERTRMEEAVEKAKLEMQYGQLLMKEDLYKRLVASQSNRLSRQVMRAQMLQDTDDRLKQLQDTKPLYRQYEEDFKLKELSWRREDESRQAMRHQSKVNLSSDEIYLHQQRHQELLEVLTRENARRRRHELLAKQLNSLDLSPSKTLARLQELDRLKEAELAGKKRRSLENLKRRKSYSLIVRQLFKPPVQLPSPPPQVEKVTRVSVEFKPRKHKPNKMLPRLPSPRASVSTDFLCERREMRRKAASSTASRSPSFLRSPTAPRSLSRLVNVCRSMEAKAQSAELIGREAPVGSLPFLEYESQADQLYIDSIKAKLSYIESIHN
jgi:hypothetical protein